jgi:hypothetical protein
MLEWPWLCAPICMHVVGFEHFAVGEARPDLVYLILQARKLGGLDSKP